MKVRHLFLLPVLMASIAAAAQTSPADRLHDFLQAANADARANWPDATYSPVFADLNGDGRDEALVWHHAGLFCGSGGCGLYIFTPEGESWRLIDDLTIVGEPVLMLSSRTRGWHDLGLMVRDGGMDRPYQVRARFNGQRYGGSSVRVPRGQRLDGRMLIGPSTPSRRLFP